MTQYKITAPRGGAADKGAKVVDLPRSKSISNRVLIMSAMAPEKARLSGIAQCDDTNVMVEALRGDLSHIDIGAAGTAMRFLTAFLTLKEGTHSITGSKRMQERPINILVDALREAGARIDYLGREGFPPLRIEGGEMRGGKIALDGGVSSQYISALMMAAPRMREGIELELRGKVVSVPYIKMTKALMEQFGIEVKTEGSKIAIAPQEYRARDYSVECDWSAASYWYEICALSPEGTQIELPNLWKESVQGDSKVADIFRSFGVETSYSPRGVVLAKRGAAAKSLKLDLVDEPDLAQTIVACSCLEGTRFHISGLGNLKIKETDRIAALKTEMAKLGYRIEEPQAGCLSWDGSCCPGDTEPEIDTYQDHRMAMAFAPLSLKLEGLKINDPEVVTKSYPGYWQDLQKYGFGVETTKG